MTVVYMDKYVHGLAHTTPDADYGLLLVDSSYTFDVAHAVLDDVVANEITGASGYARVSFGVTERFDYYHVRTYLTQDAVFTFGTMTPGEPTAAAVILFIDLGSDSVSVPLGYQLLTDNLRATLPTLRGNPTGQVVLS